MPELKCSKEVVIKCDHQDLESLIKEVYGYDYEIMPMEEVGTGQYFSTYDLDVSKEELSPNEADNIQSLREGRPVQFMLGDILTDLCNQDIIEAGDYVIAVYW